MIHGIDNRTYTNPYQRSVPPTTDKTQDAPAFLLGEEENGGVVWDRQEKKDRKENIEAKRLQKEKDAGSHFMGRQDSKEERSAKRNENAAGMAEEKAGTSFDFRKIISGIRFIFRKISNFLWYGNREDETENLSTSVEEKPEGERSGEKKLADEMEGVWKISGETKQANKTEDAEINAGKKENRPDEDTEIRRLLAQKDTDGVMEILTAHNTRRLAKKTSLLTQYDRHGEIVLPGSSEQSRILNMDKVIKM